MLGLWVRKERNGKKSTNAFAGLSNILDFDKNLATVDTFPASGL